MTDLPEHWLNGNPDRMSAECQQQNHAWTRIPRTFDDYFICSECGKRQGWTSDAENILQYIRDHPPAPELLKAILRKVRIRNEPRS